MARSTLRHPILLGALSYWALWLILMVSGDRWGLFIDNYWMTLTMVFGSFIAGATSEGGGAVAFPVMTMVFKIRPDIARDFSLMIQSVGMTAASFTIWRLRVPVESRAIVYGSLGGAAGVIVGVEVLSPRLSPPYAKMFFTSFWLAFAVALFLMNRMRDRELHRRIAAFSSSQRLGLVGAGVIGGMVSGITGSGLDIVTFSLLVLAFRIDEKVGTPTSVVLMAFNAVVGFLWRAGFSATPIAAECWGYWYVCIPVVVVGAPVGAWFIKSRPRSVVVGFLYISIAIQFIAALLIVPQTATLVAFWLTTFAAGSLLFASMARFGGRRLARVASLSEVAAST